MPSILWGSMGILLMKFGGNSRQQTMGQILGGLIVGILFAVIFGTDPSLADNLVAFISGLIMSTGILFQMKAYHNIGVSRVMPLTTGLQLLGFALIGVLGFGEWLGTPALPVGVTGVVAITGGVLLTAWTEKQDVGSPIPAPVIEPGESATLGYAPGDPVATSPANSGEAPTPNRLRVGIIQTVLCSAFYIAAPLPIRVFDVDPVTTFLPQSLGWVVMGILVTFPLVAGDRGAKDDRLSKYTLRAMIPGAMWALGVVVMQFSQATVGVAIGFSLSQMGVIISTFGGIWLLGETRTKKEMRVITLGVAFLVLGALLLGLAKSLDAPI
ncbi:MAG: GRP family sugar transporter [Scrofimicrobium sp.]